MTLHELLNDTPWSAIEAALLTAYPDAEGSLAGYKKAHAALLAKRPEDTTMRLCLDTVTDSGRQEPYLSVSGRDGTRMIDLPDVRATYAADNIPDSAQDEVTYSLALTPWAQWLAMAIDANTQKAHTPPVIVAHALWEMTFHGYEDQAVQAERQTLMDTLAQIREERDVPYRPGTDTGAGLAD